MNPGILAYIVTLLVFVAVDMVWLMGPGRPFYTAEIGGLLRSSPNLSAAAAFYLIYAAGLVFFAVNGAVQNSNPLQAITHGALLGLMAYATYDLTNLSVVNGFTLKIALIDMLWGTMLSCVTAWVATRVCLLAA